MKTSIGVSLARMLAMIAGEGGRVAPRDSSLTCYEPWRRATLRSRNGKERWKREVRRGRQVKHRRTAKHRRGR